MRITSGPNWQFYAVTAAVLFICADKQSLWPLAFWIGLCVLMVPASLGLHRWNRRQNERMAEDFPHDPFIQEKYGKK